MMGPVSKLLGCCKVAKYLKEYSVFNCLFTDKPLIEKSTP